MRSNLTRTKEQKRMIKNILIRKIEREKYEPERIIEKERIRKNDWVWTNKEEITTNEREKYMKQNTWEFKNILFYYFLFFLILYFSFEFCFPDTLFNYYYVKILNKVSPIIEPVINVKKFL